MNWDQVEGKWKEFSGKVKQKWDKLTDDDLGRIGGKKDELEGTLQKHYGYSKEQASRELDDFGRSLDSNESRINNSSRNEPSIV